MTKKALIAMSGGVDSSVAAFLMKNEYECIGATMKLFSGEESTLKSCCSADDAEDARAVAARLGMPFYVLNFTADFEKEVICNFVSCYERGETPNPCIRCNKYLKFDRLMQKMAELGADVIATGHYAKVIFNPNTQRYELHKAQDLSKDQSYVLYNLSQEQLAHIAFPLGEYRKDEVRKIALENDFVNAKKHESQDICFIPDGDYAAFIERYTGKNYPRGDFADLQGNVLGEHKGIIRYTVGQRKGLGLSLPRPMYVCEKDVPNNRIVLCYKEDLGCKEVIAENVNWVSIPCPDAPIRVKARVRYNQVEQPATCYVLQDGKIQVVFDTKQSMPAAKGQALVMYDGDKVIGGGTII